MYEGYYGLKKRPFLPVPNPDCFVPVQPAQTVLDSLIRCITQGHGIAVLTGPPGSGTTAVVRQLASVLKSSFRGVYLGTSAFPTRRALLQAILHEIGSEFIGLSEQEARLRLVDVARASMSQGNPLLLVFDEAHLLTSRLLEDIRTIADVADAGAPLMRIVIAGQPELEDLLTAPELKAFNQRVGVHLSLETLTLQQSADYILARLAWAGSSHPEATFTEAAIQGICRASDGNPRCLNQLADHALFLGFTSEARPVDIDVVRIALDDLKELPLRWNELGEFAASVPQHAAEPDDEFISTSDLREIQAASPKETDEDNVDPLADTDEFNIAALFAHEGSAAAPVDEEPPAAERLDEIDVSANHSLVFEEPADTVEFSVIEVGEGIVSPGVQEVIPIGASRHDSPSIEHDLASGDDSLNDLFRQCPTPELTDFEAVAEKTPTLWPAELTSQPAVAGESSSAASTPASPSISLEDERVINIAAHRPIPSRNTSRGTLPELGDVVEQPVYDHYALLDRRDELPAGRRSTVGLKGNPRPSYVDELIEDLVPQRERRLNGGGLFQQSNDADAASKELELLQAVNSLHQEVGSARDTEDFAGQDLDWVEYDVIQPYQSPRPVEIKSAIVSTASDVAATRLIEPQSIEAPQAGPVTASPLGNRFAQLFTRLRWRREQVQKGTDTE